MIVCYIYFSDNGWNACIDLDSVAWARIFETRGKRLVRRKLASQRASSDLPADRIEQMAGVTHASPLKSLEVSVAEAIQKVYGSSATAAVGSEGQAKERYSDIYSGEEEGEVSSLPSSRATTPEGQGFPLSGNQSTGLDYLMDPEPPMQCSGQVSQAAPATQAVMPGREQGFDEPEVDVLRALQSMTPGSLEWKELCAQISVKSLLAWTARHSSFDVSQLVEQSVPRMRFSTSAPVQHQESDFWGLDSSPELIQGFQGFMSVYRTATQANVMKHLGKYAPPRALHKPVSMSKYSLSDSLILPEAMKVPPAPLPEFLFDVQPQTTAYVRDMDLASLEGNQRKTLVILSNVLASLQAIQTAYSVADTVDPMIFRSLFALSQAMQDISTLSSLSLQQLVIHRRDVALFPKQRVSPAVPVEPAMVDELRHAPILESAFTFAPDALAEAESSRAVSSRSRLMDLAVMDFASRSSAKSKDMLKRKAQVTPSAATPVKQSKSEPKKVTPPQKPTTQAARPQSSR